MLQSADRVMCHAAAVPFANAQPRRGFAVRQAKAGEILQPVLANTHPALRADAKPRDIFIALRDKWTGDLERIEGLEAEVEALVGSAAEFRGQVMEIERESFIEERVQDATGYALTG